MTVRELINMLEQCNESGEIEVSIILHSVARTLYPDHITVVDDGDADNDGNYHGRCIIDLGEF